MSTSFVQPLGKNEESFEYAKRLDKRMKEAKEKRLNAGEFGGSLHLSGFPCPKFDLAILKAPVDLKVSGCKDFRNSDLGYLKVSYCRVRP